MRFHCTVMVRLATRVMRELNSRTNAPLLYCTLLAITKLIYSTVYPKFLAIERFLKN